MEHACILRVNEHEAREELRIEKFRHTLTAPG